jgi:hypothetical protein
VEEGGRNPQGRQGAGADLWGEGVYAWAQVLQTEEEPRLWATRLRTEEDHSANLGKPFCAVAAHAMEPQQYIGVVLFCCAGALTQ